MRKYFFLILLALAVFVAGCQGASLSACKFCPIGGKCEKSTRANLLRLARRWEEEGRILHYKIQKPEEDEGAK